MYFKEDDSKVQELDVKFLPIPSTQLEPFKRVFTGYQDGLVRSEPGGLVMLPNYGVNAEKIYRIKPRNQDDVWLLTFPKTGNQISMKLKRMQPNS